MYVDGVNIYAAMQPTQAAADAQLRVRVYMPYIGDDFFVMVGMYGQLGALEGDNIPMSNYKTSEDGVYSPVKEYAIYNMNFTNPMNCEGYPYLFFAVEGFASEPNVKVTENFVIATDVKPARSLSFEDYNNALAHNSFVRSNGESDYMRPVSVYGGSSMADFLGNEWKSYNFWICPLVRGAETPAGIEDVIVDSPTSALTLTRDGDIVTVNGVGDGSVSVFSINGVCQMSAEAANGGAVFNVSGLANGIYVIAAADGSSVKFVK